MIVRPRPRFVGVFTILRGSILTVVAPQVAAVAVLSVGVVAVQRHYPRSFETFNAAPFTLLGLALSIFLSFRNTSCYDRWWEGRRQWGTLIVEMRAFARIISILYPGDGEAAFRRQMFRSAIGFAHAVAARLRDEDEVAATAEWVVAADGPNVPDAILTSIAAALAERPRRGSVDLIPVQMVEAHVAAMAGVQAACERIHSTPLPFAYSLLLQRTAYLFCGLVPVGLAPSLGWFTPVLAGVIAYTFFGLDALGTELEEPFGRAANDLPLDALVRTIERDLLAAAGAAVPPPLVPIDHVLS